MTTRSTTVDTLAPSSPIDLDELKFAPPVHSDSTAKDPTAKDPTATNSTATDSSATRPFPEITVVVPTKNSARTLDRCLRSITAQRGHDGLPYPVELVVVDNSSTDATREIAVARADLVSVCGPERSAQRNRGLQLARGKAVLFIDSDMVLEPTVCADVVRALATPDVAGVVVPEESFGQGFWAKCRALEKRIAIGDSRTEAARGFRVDQLRELGGWDEALTAAEDWDLTDRVASCGRIDRATARIYHDEGHPTLRGNYQKKRYYGRWMAAYLAAPERQGGAGATKNVRRISPFRILRRPLLLLGQPHLAVGLIMLKAVDVAGVMVGIVAARRELGRPAAATAPR